MSIMVCSQANLVILYVAKQTVQHPDLPSLVLVCVWTGWIRTFRGMASDFHEMEVFRRMVAMVSYELRSIGAAKRLPSSESQSTLQC